MRGRTHLAAPSELRRLCLGLSRRLPSKGQRGGSVDEQSVHKLAAAHHDDRNAHQSEQPLALGVLLFGDADLPPAHAVDVFRRTCMAAGGGAVQHCESMANQITQTSYD
jgi:hypothetical protein